MKTKILIVLAVLLALRIIIGFLSSATKEVKVNQSTPTAVVKDMDKQSTPVVETDSVGWDIINQLRQASLNIGLLKESKPWKNKVTKTRPFQFSEKIMWVDLNSKSLKATCIVEVFEDVDVMDGRLKQLLKEYTRSGSYVLLASVPKQALFFLSKRISPKEFRKYKTVINNLK